MHESDLFLTDMAAEGRGHTILTRALLLVIGTCTTKLRGYPRPTLTSFLLRNGRRKAFFSTSRLSSLPRFDASSAHLVYSCLGRR